LISIGGGNAKGLALKKLMVQKNKGRIGVIAKEKMVILSHPSGIARYVYERKIVL